MTDADARETWYLPSPDGEGTLVHGAHPSGDCRGGCPLHGPSDHWASGMPLAWDYRPETGGRMMRRCPHGELHEDPDDWRFRRSRGARPDRRRPCDCGCGCDCPWEPPF